MTGTAAASRPAGLPSHEFVVTVAADHPAFDGHFPGHPILPGVALLAEVVAGAERCLGLPMDRIVIRVAKFHAPVGPGAVLAIRLVQGKGIGFMGIDFTVTEQGARVASGTLVLDESGQGASANGRAGTS